MRRFGLKTVLAIVAIGAIVSVWFGNEYERRPIAWVKYSEEALTESLNQGKLVFLFADADWNIAPKLFKHNVLDKLEVKRFLRSHGDVVPIRVDMSDDQSMALPKVLQRAGVHRGIWVGNQPWCLIWNKGDSVEMFWISGRRDEFDFIWLVEQRLQMNKAGL